MQKLARFFILRATQNEIGRYNLSYKRCTVHRQRDEARAKGEIMATAKKLSESLQAWDAVGELSFSDARFMQAESELIEVVKSALLKIQGVDDVSFERGSAGSIYFDLWSDASDDHTISIKVRVSNHQAGKRACENAANFVAGATLQEIELQLAKASQAMASEIAFILDE